jgi:predicted metalloprotease with PDZ domain
VVVSYKAPPRVVTAATNNGPLFDLREEAGGFAGAGVGFVATPVAEGPYRVHLSWDLAAAPAGSRGVWSLGEGTVDATIPAEVLAFSYYAAGPLKSYPAAGGDKFAFYWLGEPTFDAPALGERIRTLYAGMAKFFDDTGSSYRVFVRQNPYKGTGGTALAHSFMFGYEPAAKPTIDGLQGLVTHEMTHTWPAMQGEHGDTAWYSEGTAEYYSMLLSHRGGVLPADRYLAALNDKATAYYTNPYRALSNPEAAKRFWSDPIAQTVPYGRGVLYLANTDDEIRAASHGAHSLDDVVLELRRREVAGQPYGIPEWLDLVGREIGAARAKSEYEAMASGALLKLPPTRFAPCFSVVRQDARPFQLGFARASLNDDRIVRDLEPGSEAARAGVRNGDVIVTSSDVNAVRNDETKSLSLTLRRGDAEVSVTYLPRSAPTEAYRWVRNPKAPETSCKF